MRELDLIQNQITNFGRKIYKCKITKYYIGILFAFKIHMYNDNYQDEFMLTSSVFEKMLLGIQDLLHVHKTYTYTHAIESSHNPLLPGKDIAICK